MADEPRERPHDHLIEPVFAALREDEPEPPPQRRGCLLALLALLLPSG